MRRPGALIRTTVASAFALAGLLVVGFGAAQAAYDHTTVEQTISLTSPQCGGGSGNIFDISLDEGAQRIYVACGGNGKLVIERLNYDGTPAPFTANKPYVSGNKIIEEPAVPGGWIGARIAVSNVGATNGYFFTAPGDGNATSVGIYKPTGEAVGILPQPNTTLQFGDSTRDVDVGEDGSVYVAGNLPGSRIDRFNPDLTLVERLYRRNDTVTGVYNDPNNTIHADSTGALWVRHDGNRLSKFEADQFSTALGVEPLAGISSLAAVQGFPSPFYDDPIGVNGGVAVDPSTDEVIVSQGGALRPLSSGNASERVFQVAPAFGSEATALEVTKDHRVFATTGNTITRYGPGNIVPDIVTPEPSIDEIGHTTAAVVGDVDPAGGGPVTNCEVLYGESGLTSSEPCSPASFGSHQAVSAELGGLTEGTTYSYRFKATNAKGSNLGYIRQVTAAYVLKVQTLPASGIEPTGVVLNGSLDPDGLPNTTYYFEYGPDTAYGLKTPVGNASSGSGVESVSASVEDLPEGRTWHYRLVASNDNGTTHGPDQTFRTASVPDVTGARATEVTATTATLNGRINPVGFDTEYFFEYGTTADYGTTEPLAGSPESKIGSGTDPVDVALEIGGLNAGNTYHFRIVATNVWGTEVSPDTTFDFAPPACPNSQVRQETGAGYLPDCRAYELVSPGNAGSVLLFPSSEIEATAEGEYAEYFEQWHLNTGLAQSPSRFNFLGANGAVEGLDPPNGIFNILFDDYVSTRTEGGWVTTVPGRQGVEAENTGRRECSEGFEVCVDHEVPESAPYFSNTEGGKLGRLPTNLSVIPNGAYFDGEHRLSGDGSHFFFSSSNVAFTPDGVVGGLGSAYGNDIANQHVEVISRLPGGGDIVRDSGSELIQFPYVSPNGSHVLMQNEAPGNKAHLYMRVGEAITYDVAKGTTGQYAGATRDGRKVYFITDQQVPGTGDTDTSNDLFMWDEGSNSEDSVTLVSQGNGNGQSDECSATWTAGCGVKAPESERITAISFPLRPGMDDRLADASGDIFFLSPESLDPSSPASPGQRNLYLSRGGEIQLVAILDPGTRINRIQISPDGDNAAILTASQLTAYDNAGYLQMYTYDANTGAIRCASCNPNGEAPRHDVEASQGGPFMSDDGRTFFTTKDSLVPRDANGNILDFYEFVDGRPQLITAGTGARDYTGGSKVLNFATQPVYTGLESVSANGTDVYFSTFDVLIEQDENGEFIKFYDARVGGGFPPPPSLNGCEAADECHAPDEPAAAPGLIGTGDHLGSGGNVQPQKPVKSAKKRKAIAKKKKARRRAKAGKGRRG